MTRRALSMTTDNSQLELQRAFHSPIVRQRETHGCFVALAQYTVRGRDVPPRLETRLHESRCTQLRSDLEILGRSSICSAQPATSECVSCHGIEARLYTSPVGWRLRILLGLP